VTGELADATADFYLCAPCGGHARFFSDCRLLLFYMIRHGRLRMIWRCTCSTAYGMSHEAHGIAHPRHLAYDQTQHDAALRRVTPHYTTPHRCGPVPSPTAAPEVAGRAGGPPGFESRRTGGGTAVFVATAAGFAAGFAAAAMAV